MLQNLVDLYTLTGEVAHLRRADALLAAFQGVAQTMAIAYTGLLSATLSLIAPQHIVMAGDPAAEDGAAWKKALAATSLPDAIVQWITASEKLAPQSPAAGKGPIDGKTTAYICIGQKCSLPITDPEIFKETLRRERHVQVQVAAGA